MLSHHSHGGPETVQHVKIAEIKVASTGILKATLGSCVALAVINRKTGVCGLAHCLLAEAPVGEASKNARYVDQALPNLLRAVCGSSFRRSNLLGFLAGGARMIGNAIAERPAVGDFNLNAARAAFQALRIPFAELATGGIQGYNVVLDCTAQTFSYTHIEPMTHEG